MADENIPTASEDSASAAEDERADISAPAALDAASDLSHMPDSELDSLPDVDSNLVEEQEKRGQRRQRRYTVLRTLLLMLVALAVGVGVGIVVSPHIPIPGTPAVIAGKQSISADNLDTPMGTYSYKGAETTVTVRDAIEETSSLDAAKNADGTYQVPSADAVLAVARNALLQQDAKERGISATDEDARQYARDVYGTDDMAILAANYNMDSDQVLSRMRDSATLRKLRDEVVATQAPQAPQEPEPAEGGREDEPRDIYAAYIIELVGDEWDSDENTWASDEGPYRELLRDYTISNEAATYSAAKAAFEYATTQYATENQQVSSEWTAYVNEVLSKVTVEISTLVA